MLPFRPKPEAEQPDSSNTTALTARKHATTVVPPSIRNDDPDGLDDERSSQPVVAATEIVPIADYAAPSNAPSEPAPTSGGETFSALTEGTPRSRWTAPRPEILLGFTNFIVYDDATRTLPFEIDGHPEVSGSHAPTPCPLPWLYEFSWTDEALLFAGDPLNAAHALSRPRDGSRSLPPVYSARAPPYQRRRPGTGTGTGSCCCYSCPGGAPRAVHERRIHASKRKPAREPSTMRIASSKPFRFFIGPNKREFTVHSALVARQSRALGVLINNTNYKEARDAHVELEDVDEQTFVSFIQYAYTDAYTDISLPPTAEADDDSPNYGSGHYSRFHSARKKKAASVAFPYRTTQQYGNNVRLWERFKEQASQGCPSDPPPIPTMSGPGSPPSGAESFLHHARVYVFADYYGISRLTEMALYNLGQALAAFDLRDDNVEEVVELVRFCYEESRPDQLRSLVLLYAACKAEKLWKNAGFQQLVGKPGDLSTDLIGTLMDRLD
ncbi:85d318cb-82bd-4448-9ce0-4fa806733f74 [Thermothielavioides terrestris]|uniref:85d318cb-82bd-4448-9ce0-4fa806733f74 n=1 Tax=Thermothielavioides terrestris TaxID=2587410 RepID=A0A3S4AZJ3_9PEZI|nr:85d318cb-82bd-4448-9ce0-4fa806733f74 [Thermothielavioides terrestris]